MHLVERDSDLYCLTALLTETRNGGLRLATVSGPVASGKTELLNALAAHARGSGGVVLDAAAAERGRPLGLLGQLVHAVLGHLPEPRRAPLSRLLEAARADRPAPVGARPTAEASSTAEEPVPAGMTVPAATVLTGEAHLTLLGSLHDALRDIAAAGPLLAIVDDVHDCDDASLAYLSRLVDLVRAVPMLLLLGERTPVLRGAARAGYAQFNIALLRQPHFRRIRLDPLTEHGVGQVLGAELGAAGASLADECHAMTGGNPLLVRALLDDYRVGASAAREQAAGAPARLVTGDAFARVVVSCLHRAEPHALDVARGLAILGGPEAGEPEAAAAGAEELLRSLVALDVATVGSVLTALEEAGILCDGRFRADAARDAALESLQSADRAVLHVRAAALLRQQGAPADTVAGHLLRADQAPDAWGIAALREAAGLALAHDQPALAVRYLTLAARDAADARQRVSISAAVAEAHWRASPAAAVRWLPALSAALRSGELEPRDSGLLLRGQLWQGRLDDAAETIEYVAAASAGTAGGPPPMGAAADSGPVELHTMRLATYCTHPIVLAGKIGPLGLGDAAGGSAVLVEPMLHAAQVLATVVSHGPNADTVLGAEQVLQSVPLTDATMEPLLFALRALLYADRLDRVTHWAELLVRDAAARSAPTWGAMFAGLQAEAALRRGDLLAVQAHCEAALRLLPEAGWGVCVGELLAARIVASTERGEAAAAAKLLNQPLPRDTLRSRYGLAYLAARGRHHLTTQRYYAGLRDFRWCGELMAEWGLDRPEVVSWRTGAAEAYLRLNRPDQARDLVRAQLSMVGGSPSRLRGEAIRMLAAVSEPAARPKLLCQAMDDLQAAGDRLQLARTLADLGHAYRAMRDQGRARTTLRRAWHVAKDCGAELLCASLMPSIGGDDGTNRPAGRVVLPVQSVERLTGAERRVAALAARGYTNREIASSLYVTMSTVEQHLTRVYKKLAIRRRSDLSVGLEALAAETG